MKERSFTNYFKAWDPKVKKKTPTILNVRLSCLTSMTPNLFHDPSMTGALTNILTLTKKNKSSGVKNKQ